MKALISLLLIIISCSDVGKTVNFNKVSSVRLYYHLQFPKKDGTLMDIHDSVDVFRYNEYFIYKNPAPYIFSNVILDRKGNQISEKTIIDTVKFNYIVCKVDHKYGLFYDSLNTMTPKKVAIDHFKHSRTLDQLPFFSENDSLVSILRSDKVPLLTEVRVPKIIKNESYCNSKVYYYSNEFIDAPFSFSKKLDSIKHIKLYKVRMIYNAAIIRGIKVPKREFYFELKKAKAGPEIPQLIERFKAMATKGDM